MYDEGSVHKTDWRNRVVFLVEFDAVFIDKGPVHACIWVDPSFDFDFNNCLAMP